MSDVTYKVGLKSAISAQHHRAWETFYGDFCHIIHRCEKHNCRAKIKFYHRTITMIKIFGKVLLRFYLSLQIVTELEILELSNDNDKTQLFVFLYCYDLFRDYFNLFNLKNAGELSGKFLVMC